MRQTIIVTIILLLAYCGMMAQSAWEVPVGSKANVLVLSVNNTSIAPLYGVTVSVLNAPEWVRFDSTQVEFFRLDGNAEREVQFSFDVLPDATIGQKGTLALQVRSVRGDTWQKNIEVITAAPSGGGLGQNYPNPFNPTTTISYSIPAKSLVSLKVFDLLGRQVATLVDGEKDAGYHQEVWNAASYASGMYFYELTFTDASGQRQMFRKAMIILK